MKQNRFVTAARKNPENTYLRLFCLLIVVKIEKIDRNAISGRALSVAETSFDFRRVRS